jgi:enoyl-CoA hydratase
MSGRVEFEVDGYVAKITLNRPEKLNAISREMALQMQAIVKRCNTDDIRAVIFTGAGEKAFCAGSDIRQLDEHDTIWALRNREDYCRPVRKIRCPVICAINGYALGGGLEMAMGADIRIAAPKAKLGSPEIKLGWIGGGGMSVHLSRSGGSSNASLMLMTGDPIDAETALRWGLISQVCEPEQLLLRTREIADAIAARAPIAAEHAKLNLDAAANMPAEHAMRYELGLQTAAFATEDADEGRRAFAEKRPPVFQCR